MFLRSLLLIGFMLFIFEGTALAKNIAFQGQLDLRNKTLDITVHLAQDDYINVKVSQVSPVDYQLLLDVRNFKSFPVHLSGNLESSLNIARDENTLDQFIQGKIWSQEVDSLNKPVKNVSGLFEIRDQRLLINDLAIGNMHCQGNMNLTYPYKLDLTVQLASVEMDDFLDIWMDDRDFETQGSVTGEIKVSGGYPQIQLKGALESYDGFVSELKYISIYLHAEGIYPNLKIANSSVSQKDGMRFSLDGSLALNDKTNFKKQIKVLKFEPLVSISENSSEWTIKREKDEGSRTTELKYFLRKDESIDSHLKEESNMVGVKKTLEF